ncbi:hypothetical protein JHK82_051054 [Glycine max]|nr:hypothetical protein JHK85_051752 [Glycine max]KAG5092276.1 hypothetical protein JHK82_051054 [Glycine max]
MHPLSLVYKFAQNQTKLVPTNQNITTAWLRFCTRLGLVLIKRALQEEALSRRSLECLDRVAIIIVPNLTPKEQKLDRWKLCSVIEVQEAEIFFLKIPLRLNFAMCGVVTSMEGTYCMEQGNKMNPYLGKLQFPLFDEI